MTDEMHEYLLYDEIAQISSFYYDMNNFSSIGLYCFTSSLFKCNSKLTNGKDISLYNKVVDIRGPNYSSEIGEHIEIKLINSHHSLPSQKVVVKLYRGKNSRK